ncbi:unnamed protein product, partial [Linum tenue]
RRKAFSLLSAIAKFPTVPIRFFRKASQAHCEQQEEALHSFLPMASLLKTLAKQSSGLVGSSTPTATRNFSLVSSQISQHTGKWMQDTTKKSPMELINEIPPIKVEGRIAACEGDTNPALGHPIEFICLDLKEPAVCKYCGLRFVQDHHH